MAAVGDLVLILPAWGKGHYFNAGDTGVLTRLDADGDWWANIDGRENACIGVEGKYFSVTSRSPEVAQLQARVAELEGALAAVTGALDKMGDQPDHRVCPDVWRRFDCETHVVKAREVLGS